MKRAVKLLIALAIVAMVCIACFSFVRQCTSQAVVGNAVASLTGSEKAGQAAADIMNGVDLSDAELADAFGLDANTFARIKDAAADAGIDLNDSGQLRDIALANADKLGELKSLASELTSGALSAEDAAAQLKDTLTIPEAN